MKVTTDLRVADIVTISVTNYVTSRARYIVSVAMGFAYAGYLIASLGMPVDQRAWMIYAAGGVFFAVAFFLLFLTVSVLNAAMIVRNMPGVIGPHDMQILPEGLRDATPYMETLSRWPAMVRITRRGNHLAFWTSPYIAHIVPKRAFSDAEGFNAFERRARAYLAGETVTPEPATPLPIRIDSNPAVWKRPA